MTICGENEDLMVDEEQGSLLAMLARGQVESATSIGGSPTAVPLSVVGFAGSSLISVVAPASGGISPGAKMGLLLAAHEVTAWSAMWTVPARAAIPENATDEPVIITWIVGPDGMNQIEAWGIDGESRGAIGSAQDAPPSLFHESPEPLALSAAWARARTVDLPEIGVARDALTAGLRQEGLHVTVRDQLPATSEESTT